MVEMMENFMVIAGMISDGLSMAVDCEWLIVMIAGCDG